MYMYMYIYFACETNHMVSGVTNQSAVPSSGENIEHKNVILFQYRGTLKVSHGCRHCILLYNTQEGMLICITVVLIEYSNVYKLNV